MKAPSSGRRRSLALCLPCFEHIHHITNFPKPLGHFSGHCGRGAQLLMDANEIVVHREQRDGMGVVLNLFRECVSQPSKSARVHPNVEVLPLPGDQAFAAARERYEQQLWQSYQATNQAPMAGRPTAYEQGIVHPSTPSAGAPSITQGTFGPYSFGPVNPMPPASPAPSPGVAGPSGAAPVGPAASPFVSNVVSPQIMAEISYFAAITGLTPEAAAALLGYRHAADGGKAPRGEPVLVGERGPEVFIPDQSGTVVPQYYVPPFVGSAEEFRGHNRYGGWPKVPACMARPRGTRWLPRSTNVRAATMY